MINSLADQLSYVAKTLCGKAWTLRNIDAELQRLLNQCLHKLDCVGVVAFFAEGPVILQHFLPAAVPEGQSARELARQIASRIEPHLAGNTCPISVREEVRGLTAVAGTCLPPVTGAHPGKGGFCALVYRPRNADPTLLDRADTFHAHSTVGLIYQVLLHRVRMFSPFAPSASEAYWDDADARLAADVPRLVPPWALARSISTATLSLDLRKSTFCMENAHPPSRFALWLDQLVQILTRVTHLHGGVFDKFTGDGALVHFLAANESDESVARAVDIAFECALSMHRAMRLHVDLLRTFLRFESDILGAAIGLDVAPTYWSLDHRNNPITVGRGVVNACRIGDKTEAGGTRVTNIAYQHLLRTRGGGHFRKVPFVSKEVPADMKVKVWELPRGASSNERFIDATNAIVADVHGTPADDRA
jgi:class 3 adenylate cyclase